MFDTFCRLPSDVTNMIMSYYICRPKFEFKIDHFKLPCLVLNSIGSNIIYYLPDHWRVATNDIKNILIEDCGRYEIIGEHTGMTFTIDKDIIIDNDITILSVDIGSLPSLRTAISDYLNYLNN